MGYQVKVEAFEGPIDLLLHLITRQRVDIYDIPLAAITEEYLAAVARMEHVDLESATGFLVVAATLLELKAARLLPAGDEGARRELLEERDLLLARLVECSTYRDAGTWIAARLEAGRALHGRTASIEEPFATLVPDLLAHTTPGDIGAAAARVLARPAPLRLDVSHLAPIRASVRDAIADMAARLERRGGLTFKEMCSGAPARIDVVVRFLALLELYKAGAIELTQHARWGEIEAAWTGEVSAAEVVSDADEYGLTTSEARQ